MRTRAAVLTCTTLLSAACGASMDPGAMRGSTDTAAVAAYQGLSSDVQTAATAYDATMAGPGMTLEACAATHDAYDAQVRAWVSQMMQRSAAMDAYMDAHGGVAYADMTCVANAMLAELDAHRAAACTFTTLADDRAEAARHVGAMTAYTSHVSDRCGTMTGMMGGGGAGWSPAASGCGGGTAGTADPLARGQRLFESGIGADGRPVARTGGVGMMGASGCASCHGFDGHGRTTMMFTSPNVTYANLTDPAGMREPDGTRGSTYTDDLVRRAVTQGLDAGGQPLAAAMPRWQLGDQDWADLLAYLKTLP